MGRKKKISLDDLINSDPNNVIPPHLMREGIDTRVINAAFQYGGNREILERLWQRMDLKTGQTFWDTFEWYTAQVRAGHDAARKAEMALQRQRTEKAWRKVVEGESEAQVTYLINQGLSTEQANSSWRKFLLWVDSTIAYLCGRKLYRAEPVKPELYTFTAYPVQRVVRYLMLLGANTKEYDLRNLLAGKNSLLDDTKVDDTKGNRQPS